MQSNASSEATLDYAAVWNYKKTLRMTKGLLGVQTTGSKDELSEI
jgi:hypothetical protein